MIGIAERTSFDDISERGNAVFLHMSGLRRPIKTFIGVGAGVSGGGGLLFGAGQVVFGLAGLSTITTIGIGVGPPIIKGAIQNQEAISLVEKLAVTEAQTGMGRVIMTELGDAPRLKAVYGSGDWVKVEHVHRLANGSRVVIHYFRNLATGQNVEFKFKR